MKVLREFFKSVAKLLARLHEDPGIGRPKATTMAGVARTQIHKLTEIINMIDLDRSGIKKKLEAKIEQHNRFHSGIMGKPEEEYNAKDADIRNYAKYLLQEGSMFEKRDLLTCLKSKIIFQVKRISIEN